ncbi:hypothetical protein QTP70_033377 [Hemibagrus guttatus]|uniref:Large ribosomal subunit protein mL52 n=1 Tax=Hemibagrus guttatus TaxID=175788 RepID=A0AAE0R969_9TELE|nr:hypothetical protein QTP70_033377 [Hemibagrus guttatus]
MREEDCKLSGENKSLVLKIFVVRGPVEFKMAAPLKLLCTSVLRQTVRPFSSTCAVHAGKKWRLENGLAWTGSEYGPITDLPDWSFADGRPAPPLKGQVRRQKQREDFAQDNDPKHTSKSTSEWLKKNKMKTLEWPSQSPDLNLIEMLWHDLKKVVHVRKPSNVAELQQFCKDEWAKIPPQRCNRLIASYQKRLIAVVAAKGGPTSY